MPIDDCRFGDVTARISGLLAGERHVPSEWADSRTLRQAAVVH